MPAVQTQGVEINPITHIEPGTVAWACNPRDGEDTSTPQKLSDQPSLAESATGGSQ